MGGGCGKESFTGAGRVSGSGSESISTISASAGFLRERLIGEICASSLSEPSGPDGSGEIGRSFRGALLAALGRLARLASAPLLIVPPRLGLSESDSQVCCERAVCNEELTIVFDSFSAAVAVSGACRVFKTCKAGADGSEATLIGSADFAVSSLIVRAARRMVPDLPACGSGRVGGGINSASLAALRTAASGLVVTTSLCDTSLRPSARLCGLFASRTGFSSRVLGGSQLLTVEM